MKIFFSILSVVAVLTASSASAYGPLGHETVGAIADERLANTPAGKKVNELLDGITLEKAAVIPDEIKGWDKKGVDDPKSFHYSTHPQIDAQLREFWRANQPTHDANSPNPSHHWFHYTDVPVIRGEKYADGTAGRSKWDIVHMIPFCVDVVRGEVPENNERKITKPVALILLAHYVGDIHQPLHVGAQYFDKGGHPDDPDKDKASLADEGGNTFYLHLVSDPPAGRSSHAKKLHGYWDLDTVYSLLPLAPQTLAKDERRAQNETGRKALSHKMATQEPKNWRLPPNIELKKYAEAWADEILPIALEAHERLAFRDVKPLQEEDRVVATGDADEKAASDHVTYQDWSAKIVREELHKAGWRLADLLEKSVTSGATTAPPPASTPSVAPQPEDSEASEPETPPLPPTTPAPSAAATASAPPPPTPTATPDGLATSVTLTKPVKVRVRYGEITLPVGLTLPVISRDGTMVRVQYMNSTHTIPASSTVSVAAPASSPR